MSLINTFDAGVNNFFISIRSEVVTDFFYFFTIIFDVSTIFIILSLVTALLIYKMRGLRYLKIFTTSLFFGALAVLFLKFIFDVDRPSSSIIFAFGQSFPSYHATSSTIYFLILYYSFHQYFLGVRGVVFKVFCLAFVLLVSLSRLYLGVHWASDVLGGIVLGCIIAYLSIVFFEKYTKK